MLFIAQDKVQTTFYILHPNLRPYCQLVIVGLGVMDRKIAGSCLVASRCALIKMWTSYIYGWVGELILEDSEIYIGKVS